MTSRLIFSETRHALRGATILTCIFFSMPFLEGYPFLFALKFGAIAFCSAFVGFLALFHSYFITVSADRITFFQFFLPLGIFKKSEIKSMKMLPFAKLQIVEKHGGRREFSVRFFDENTIRALIRDFGQK